MLIDQKSKSIFESIALFMKFRSQIIIFACSIQQSRSLKLFIKECLKGLDVIGNLAKQRPDRIVALNDGRDSRFEAIACNVRSYDFFYLGRSHW